MGSSVSVRIHAFPWNVPATIRGSADKESLHRIAAPRPQLAEASAASKLAAHLSTAHAAIVGATARPGVRQICGGAFAAGGEGIVGATLVVARVRLPKTCVRGAGRHKGVPYDGFGLVRR